MDTRPLDPRALDWREQVNASISHGRWGWALSQAVMQLGVSTAAPSTVEICRPYLARVPTWSHACGRHVTEDETILAHWSIYALAGGPIAERSATEWLRMYSHAPLREDARQARYLQVELGWVPFGFGFREYVRAMACYSTVGVWEAAQFLAFEYMQHRPGPYYARYVEAWATRPSLLPWGDR